MHCIYIGNSSKCTDELYVTSHNTYTAVLVLDATCKYYTFLTIIASRTHITKVTFTLF